MATTTTAKRGPGRPKKATESSSAMKVKSPKMKTKIKQKGSIEYELTKPNGAIYMMRNTSYNLFDEESNSIRNVRYSESEPSIFVEDQNQRAIKSPVIFYGGKLFVERSKPNLLEFLDNHPQNEENGGNTFRKVNTDKVAEVELDSEFLVVDAISLIRTKPLDDLLAVAISRGIDVDRPVNEVKHDLVVFAKRNPVVFIESFDNPVVRTKATVKQAREYQILKIDESSVKWFDTNKMIVSVPVGRDPIDVVVRFLLTEAGAPVLEELNNQLSK